MDKYAITITYFNSTTFIIYIYNLFWIEWTNIKEERYLFGERIGAKIDLVGCMKRRECSVLLGNCFTFTFTIKKIKKISAAVAAASIKSLTTLQYTNTPSIFLFLHFVFFITTLSNIFNTYFIIILKL